jgi:hypothetical protein
MTAPWEFDGTWFHFVETVHGAWLYGDARGFRTRHHREHVEGDYKAPPPLEQYAEERQRSMGALTHPPVMVPSEWRPIIGTAIHERLTELEVFPLCLSMSGQHLHALVKVRRSVSARDCMGLAKKHAAFEAKARGWVGKLWGKRGKELRIRDRQHQVNVFRYILAHAKEGAWVRRWSR